MIPLLLWGRGSSGIVHTFLNVPVTPPRHTLGPFSGTTENKMKTIQELREDRVHALRSADDLTNKIEKENRLPTDDEKRSIDDLLATAKKVADEITAIEDAESQRAKVRDAVNSLAKSNDRRTVAQQPNPNPPESDRIEISGPQVRFGKLKAFRGADAERNAYKSGQAIRALLFNNLRAVRWCNDNGVQVRALSEGSNTAGGFLVPDEMSQAIVDLREEYGVFRRNCKVMPMGSDTLTVPRRTGGLTAYFTGENTALTSSDKTWDIIQLVAKKLGVLTYLSTELDEDAIINIADDLAGEMAYAFALKEDQCGFNGDGSSTYGGIFGVTQKILGLAGAVDGASGHDTYAEIDATDLANVMGKLPAYARLGAKWFVSQTGFDVMFGRLAIGAGGNTIQTVAGAVQRSYLGYPIEIVQVLPTSTGDLSDVVMALFGNLAQAATLGERRGIAVRRSDEIKFIEDQVALKATERVDINVHDVGDATTAGPIVALIGE
jgi:HK97 family phage major capsid protein